ncbi:hypothetical protein V1506DRAFT_569458 [Lipomyces tetrasporus]
MTYPLSDSFCTRFHCSKPFLPYYPGREWSILSHDPPAPTVGHCDLTRDGAWEREWKHPLERCILHPPRPGSFGTTTVDLKIVDIVRAGDQHSSQLVTVQVVNVDPPESSLPTSNIPLMAKIYDPLYFDHEQDDADPFLCVDRAYCQEAAAYKALSELQGTIIPRYYGSYSFDLPAGDATTRSVRLILIEVVPGSCMLQLDPVDFSQSERQVIMKAIVDAESLLYTHNVLHGDVHPRNILILDTGREISARQVVLVDLGRARIGRSTRLDNPEYEKKYLPGVPISPLLRWNKAWFKLRDYEYASDASMAYMKSIWLPSFLFRPLPPEPRFGDVSGKRLRY